MVRKAKKALRITKTKKAAPAKAHGKFYLLLVKLVEYVGNAVIAYERRLRLHAGEKEVARRENLVQCEIDALDNIKKKHAAQEQRLNDWETKLEERASELQSLEEELAKEEAALKDKQASKVDVTNLMNQKLDKIEEALEKVPSSARLQGYCIVQEGSGEPKILEISSKAEAVRLIERARSGEIELLF